MAFIMVALFNALRPLVVIVCTIPFIAIGITAGLLIFDVPFGFLAVLGVIPLLNDVFWIGLAVTMMAGLTFGTFLTMIMVPTFYATFYKLESSEGA